MKHVKNFKNFQINESNDDISYMAYQELESIAKKANEILKMMKEKNIQKLDSWVESHITQSATQISSIYDFMKFGDNESDSFKTK